MIEDRLYKGLGLEFAMTIRTSMLCFEDKSTVRFKEGTHAVLPSKIRIRKEWVLVFLSIAIPFVTQILLIQVYSRPRANMCWKHDHRDDDDDDDDDDEQMA